MKPASNSEGPQYQWGINNISSNILSLQRILNFPGAGWNATFHVLDNVSHSLKDTIQHPYQLYFLPVPIVISLLVSIQIVSFSGNAIVVYIIMKKLRLRTSTNWLMLNLAISDLVTATFCITLDIPLVISQKWIYGKYLCSVYYPIGSAALFSSVFTLELLTCLRYWAVVHPLKKEFSVYKTKICIAGAWFASFLLVLPIVVVLKHNNQYQVCFEDWRSSQRRIYTVLIFSLGYVIPLLSMTLAYSSIIYKVTLKKSTATACRDKLRQDENRRLSQLSITITITFAVCVLPNQLVWMLYEFSSFASYKYRMDIRLASHVMLFMSSAVNPIIYGVFSSKFREASSEVHVRWSKYVQEKTSILNTNV